MTRKRRRELEAELQDEVLYETALDVVLGLGVAPPDDTFEGKVRRAAAQHVKDLMERGER